MMFHELKIGVLTLKNNILAAPMAGLSSLPYRLIAMGQGCALAFSEMISTEGLVRNNERTKRYFENDAESRPFGVQLFGAAPEIFKTAVEMLEIESIDVVDINMGCPVKKVCSKGAGSALMKTPRAASKIIRAVRDSTKRPLTVKIRAGWDETSVNCVEFGRMAEASGADAVILHPRTRQQFFKGHSDWQFIEKLKHAVKIPVIGNGDIKTRSDALKMIETTGCDGIMIGRAAVGNPWIFRQIINDSSDMPSREERGRIALYHFQKLIKTSGKRAAVLNMRALLPWYGKGLMGIKKLTQEIYKTDDVEEAREKIRGFFSAPFQVS